jgi:hypothetical protein
MKKYYLSNIVCSIFLSTILTIIGVKWLINYFLAGAILSWYWENICEYILNFNKKRN